MATEDYSSARAEQFIAWQKAKQAAEGADTKPSDATDDVDASADVPTDEKPSADDAPATKDETIVQDDTEDTTPPADTETPQGEDTDVDAAPGEGEVEVDAETVELDDATIAEIAKVYRDKLLSTEDIQSQVKAIIEAQVQEQQRELQRAAQEKSEVDSLIERGRVALDGMSDMLTAASAELEKAKREEDFSTGVLDSEKFERHLNDYGMSIVAEVQGRYNRALDGAILDSLRELPTLSDAQVVELQNIVTTAQRMEGDPNQSRNAVPYAATNFVKFLLTRAREAGAADERARVTSLTAVNKKVAESAAAKAAAAKLAASRGKTPPNTPANAKSEASDGAISEEAYDRAVAKGDYEEADRIVNAMARRVVARA